MGRLTEVNQFEDIVVKAGDDAALVRVKDIGRVELGAETYSSNLRFGGLNAAGVGIQLLPTANALEAFQGVMAEMARLERTFPPGLEWRLAFDNVGVVRESIIEVLKTLAEAIVLVILVMFLFLQNWRSTIIPTLTIPVSLVGTFAFLKLFDFSINTLTLFGIVLATGIVVDDAIVVIENIERHMREYGKSAQQAALDAHARGVRCRRRHRHRAGGGVRAGGVLSRHDRPPVSAVLADDRVRDHSVGVQCRHVDPGAVGAAAGQTRPWTRDASFRRVNRVIEASTRGYARVLGRALQWKMVMLALFVVGLWGTWAIFQRVPSAFVPQEDEGYFMTIIQAPSGASLEYTTNIAQQAEKILFAQPEIEGVFSVLGLQLYRRRGQQRHDVREPARLERAAGQGPVARGGAQSCARSAVRHSGRHGRVVCAAGHPGAVGVRRLPVRSAGSVGRRHHRPGQRHAGAGRPRQSERPRGGAVHAVPRRRSAAAGQHRSRSRAQPRAARCAR